MVGTGAGWRMIVRLGLGLRAGGTLRVAPLGTGRRCHAETAIHVHLGSTARLLRLRLLLLRPTLGRVLQVGSCSAPLPASPDVGNGAPD